MTKYVSLKWNVLAGSDMQVASTPFGSYQVYPGAKDIWHVASMFFSTIATSLAEAQAMAEQDFHDRLRKVTVAEPPPPRLCKKVFVLGVRSVEAIFYLTPNHFYTSDVQKAMTFDIYEEAMIWRNKFETPSHEVFETTISAW